MSSPSVTEPRSIWSGSLLAVTVGSIALIVLAAFESLAVTTVMPIISDEFDGASLYSLAFAGTMAAGVIGMIGIGTWCDRRGPVMPLIAAVTLFVIGLLVAGFAGDMPPLVVGRVIQGLGAGGQTVALYVLVARLYPPALNGKVFAAFATAWVFPALVGPFIAGAVAERLHWRWVFWGVAILTIAAFLAILPRLRKLDVGSSDAAVIGKTAVRLGLAIVVASMAMALGLVGEWPIPFSLLGVAVALIIIVIAVRPLLPPRTLVAGRGLPSVILMRGLIAGSLFGAEVYLPYLLRDHYGFSAEFSGLALTGSAVLWAVASNIQGRFGDVLGNRRTALIGISVLVTSVALTSIIVFAHAPAWALIVVWSFAGGGIGLMYPRTTVLMLAYSTPHNQGFNSSALSISDSLVAASTIALLGIALQTTGNSVGGFGLVFAGAAVLGLLALIPGLRLGHAAESPARG